MAKRRKAGTVTGRKTVTATETKMTKMKTRTGRKTAMGKMKMTTKMTT